MKIQIIYGLVRFTMVLFATVSIQAQDTAKVYSTFIGSHGYLIEGSEKKVAIDAHIYWEHNEWGYLSPPLSVKEQIENAEAPFNNIDLIFISHAHDDHYNPQLLEQSMHLNTDAIVVTNQPVYDDLAAGMNDISAIANRFWVPQLDYYESRDTIVNGIPFSFTNVEHGSPSIPLYTFSFEVDGIRFVHLNGWSPATIRYDTLGFNQQRADVAYLGYDFLFDNAKFTKFETHINPCFSTITHIDGVNATRYETIQNRIDELQDDHAMNLTYTPLDKLLFQKVNDTFLVDTVAYNNQRLIPTAMEDQLSTNLHKVCLYPNPASKAIHFHTHAEDPVNWISIYNTRGKQELLVDSKNIEKGEIDISGLKEGFYFATFQIGNQVTTCKLSVRD